MKKCFLVLVLGYWGRGDTLKKAAFQCKANGAKNTERAVAFLIVGDDTATVDSMGCIVRDVGSENITIGAGFKLGQLTKLED